MTKREQSAINKFVRKMLAAGAMIPNYKLPVRMWARKGKLSRYSLTAVVSRKQLIKLWNELQRALEPS